QKEHYDFWNQQLSPITVEPGTFGENILTHGLDECVQTLFGNQPPRIADCHRTPTRVEIRCLVRCIQERKVLRIDGEGDYLSFPFETSPPSPLLRFSV
ncbi:MAG: MOSC domain-containing protein, partial [Candidatus Omnitrophica bacterium]|nr:MOSC domain-containing protein [Candidatus Omnitrophota bacterium]